MIDNKRKITGKSDCAVIRGKNGYHTRQDGQGRSCSVIGSGSPKSSFSDSITFDRDASYLLTESVRSVASIFD